VARHPLAAGVLIALAIAAVLWAVWGALWLTRQWQLAAAVAAFHILTQAHQGSADAA
jgi:hypothetical protein